MNYEGHRNGGIVSAIGVGAISLFLTFNPMIAVVCAITTLIMALYPDFDTGSTPSKYSFIIGIPLIIILG